MTSLHNTSSSTCTHGCRLYKYDSGQLNRVSLPEDTLSALAQPDLDAEWSKLVDPAASASQRDTLAASLFSLPTDGRPLPSAASHILMCARINKCLFMPCIELKYSN